MSKTKFEVQKTTWKYWWNKIEDAVLPVFAQSLWIYFKFISVLFENCFWCYFKQLFIPLAKRTVIYLKLFWYKVFVHLKLEWNCWICYRISIVWIFYSCFERRSFYSSTWQCTIYLMLSCIFTLYFRTQTVNHAISITWKSCSSAGTSQPLCNALYTVAINSFHLNGHTDWNLSNHKRNKRRSNRLAQHIKW